MDLIDRQQAIDALKEHRSLYCDNTPETFSELSYAEKSRVDELDTAIATLVNLPAIQPVATDMNAGDKISKFIDGLEVIFADLRERHVDDSVCGLCEYDGAYMGQSGDWCNECPGFDRDDCFKLSDKTRKKWTEEIIKALPTVQPEQKSARWTKAYDGNDGHVKCTCCFKTYDWISQAQYYNFCPNCGADMRGEK